MPRVLRLRTVQATPVVQDGRVAVLKRKIHGEVRSADKVLVDLAGVRVLFLAGVDHRQAGSVLNGAGERRREQRTRVQ